MPRLAWTLVALVVGGAWLEVDSARMLAVLPIPSRSHSMWHFALFRLLSSRGHHVEVYAVLPPPCQIENVTFVDLSDAFVGKFHTYEDYKGMFTSFSPSYLWESCTELSEKVFEHEHVQRLLSSSQTFDLVFVEATVGQEAFLVFAHHFNAPVINLQGFPVWSVVNWVVGNSLAGSYTPENLSFPYTTTMTFLERLNNVVSILTSLTTYHFRHLPRQQDIIDRLYKGKRPPPITKMLQNMSLTLSNTIATVEYPRPYTPNLVPIGGAHIDLPTSPLTQDIKKFMDDAKEGVIYFSLGTVVPSELMPAEFIRAFVDAFKNIPKKILWKTDLEDIPGLPKHVMLAKWVSQLAVLAHPNCVLFMTHGGLFSQHEALYAGRPVVAIPFFADQGYNARFYEHLGSGLRLDPTTLTSRSVYSAVMTALNDPRFAGEAARVARLVRDQPVSPADTAVFWVEYVLRHGGAHHLAPASASIPWYQLFHIDVLLALLAILVGVASMAVVIFRLTLRRCSREEAICKKLR